MISVPNYIFITIAIFFLKIKKSVRSLSEASAEKTSSIDMHSIKSVFASYVSPNLSAVLYIYTCMYTYIQTYIYIHIYIYVLYIHTYIQTYIYIYMFYKYIHTYIHTYNIYIYIYIFTHARTHSHTQQTHTHTHTHTHIYIYIYIYIYTQTHIHTHKHTHTHIYKDIIGILIRKKKTFILAIKYLFLKYYAIHFNAFSQTLLI